MIGITHKLRGFDALRERLSSLPANAQTAVAVATETIASEAAADLQTRLEQNNGIGPRRHSLTGEKPSDPRGRLAAAVSVTPTPDRPGAIVTVDLPFARNLEFGTSRMPARPFLRPTMLQAAGSAKTALGAALRSACSTLTRDSR